MLGRRSFLARLIAAAGVAQSAAVRGLSVAAQTLRFRPLSRPVVVPLEDLTSTSRAHPFMADAVTLPTAANPNQPIRVSGAVARVKGAGGAGGAGGPGGAGPSTALRASGDASPDDFTAVCLKCPHEGCDVEFVPDPGKLPAEAFAELPAVPKEPVYVCPCHNSTFRARDGERLGGPAPRGLYRFRVTDVSGGQVQIGEVEEDVLVFVE